MNTTHTTETAPRVGDQVMLRGTRLVGDVTQIETGDAGESGDRVSVKVTAVLGKKSGSKAARAWRGAWVRCGSALVTPAPQSVN